MRKLKGKSLIFQLHALINIKLNYTENFNLILTCDQKKNSEITMHSKIMLIKIYFYFLESVIIFCFQQHENQIDSTGDDRDY